MVKCIHNITHTPDEVKWFKMRKDDLIEDYLYI